MRNLKFIQVLLRSLTLLAILSVSMSMAIPVGAVQPALSQKIDGRKLNSVSVKVNLQTPDEVKTTQIDFEGLAEGQFVDQVSSGSGMQGSPVPGTVSIFGERNRDAVKNKNHAMIFDATCHSTTTNICSGGDSDLRFPEHGNILILSEDDNASNPNDDSSGGVFTIDFTHFGPGEVNIVSLDVLDIDVTEAGNKLELLRDGVLLQTIQIPVTGNNGQVTLAIDAGPLDQLRVYLKGSGAIDNLKLSVSVPNGTPIEDDRTIQKLYLPVITH